MTFFYIRKKTRKQVLIFFTAWFSCVHSLLPAVVLAEELPATVSGSTPVTGHPPTPSSSPSIEPAAPDMTDEDISSAPRILSTPEPTAAPDQNMETGDAYATSQIAAVVNTTLQDSTVEIEQGDIIGELNDDISLFDTSDCPSTPSASAEEQDDPIPGEIAIVATNSAAVTASAAASATSGGNSQTTTGSAAMATGDAAATAYATTVANTTLIDSQLEIALMTILTEWDGNIVLQPFTPEELEQLSAAVGRLYITNAGEVVTQAQASAVTGENIQVTGGDAALTTGYARAVSSAVTVANSTLIDAIVFDFFVQNWILWTGHVHNWSSPGSRENPADVIGRHILAGRQEDCGECNTDLTVRNSSLVTTTATATADTGGNSQEASGTASLTTGSAFASAMAASVVNATLINSRYRLLSLNLLAPWSGNLIFAYPDLAVSISAPARVRAGTDIQYTVHVANTGYRADRAVTVGSGGTHRSIGDLAPFQSGQHTFTRSTDGLAGQTVTLTAAAVGELTEESLDNNVSTATVIIEDESAPVEKNGEEDSVSHDIPELALTAQNNIATFIYPGDTARYEVTVTNNGPGTAYDTVFRNILFTSDGSAVGTVQASVGHIRHGESKTIRFGLATSSSLPAGEYYTVSVLTGRSDDQTLISSNQVTTAVPVRTHYSLAVDTVSAHDLTQPAPAEAAGDVKGAMDSACRACGWAEVLFAATSALIALYAYAGRSSRSRRLSTMSLGWGLLGYTALLLANADCVNGFTLVSGSFLCTYFLPLTLGESIVIHGLLTLRKPARTVPSLTPTP